MSAPVTQWFEYDRMKPFDSTHPMTSRQGWYDVKRGNSRIHWRGYWNGNRFSKLRSVSPCSSKTWWNAIFKYPNVTAWRGLADKPATPPKSKP